MKGHVHAAIPITDGMNLYRDASVFSVNVQRHLQREEEGAEVPVISFKTIDCTYIETGNHLQHKEIHPLGLLRQRGGGDVFDEYRAVVAHVKAEQKGEIGFDDIKDAVKRVREDDAFVVSAVVGKLGYTDGWLKICNGHIGTRDYNRNSPHFSVEAMKAIMESGASLLAGDFPSFSPVDETKGYGLEMLKIFYTKGRNMIMAPLINLHEVSDGVVALTVNPLPFEEICPLPCCPTIYQGRLGRAHMEEIDRFYKSLRGK